MLRMEEYFRLRRDPVENIFSFLGTNKDLQDYRREIPVPITAMGALCRVQIQDIDRFWNLGVLTPFIENPLFFQEEGWRPTIELLVLLFAGWYARYTQEYLFRRTTKSDLLPPVLSRKKQIQTFHLEFFNQVNYWQDIFMTLSPEIFTEKIPIWQKNVSLLPSIQSLRRNSVSPIANRRKIVFDKKLGRGDFGYVIDMNLKIGNQTVVKDVAMKLIRKEDIFEAGTATEVLVSYMVSLLVQTNVTRGFPLFLGDMIMHKNTREGLSIFQCIFMNFLDGKIEDYLETLKSQSRRKQFNRWMNVFLSVFQACGMAELYFAFGHGDLHLGNVFFYMLDDPPETSTIDVVPEQFLKPLSSQSPQVQARWEEQSLNASFSLSYVDIQPVVGDFGFSTARVPTQWLVSKMLKVEDSETLVSWKEPWEPPHRVFEGVPSNFLILNTISKPLMENYLLYRDSFQRYWGTAKTNLILPTEEELLVSIFRSSSISSAEALAQYQEAFPDWPTTLEEELDYMHTFPQRKTQKRYYLPFHKEVFLATAKQSALEFLLFMGYTLDGAMNQYLQQICPLFEYLLTISNDHFVIRDFIGGLYPYLTFGNLYSSPHFILYTHDFLNKYR